MLRRNVFRRAGVADFVDTAYLRGQRPKVPGGAWTTELLEGKSTADLQQLWFVLLRERNMLGSMKDHYVRHMEELGAFPAPSRLTMVEESMSNIRQVMMRRDNEAADEAETTFKARIDKGVYRYPSGPQEPADSANVSHVTIQLSKMVDETRLRELFGRYDVFDEHKGIVSIEASPTDETLALKEAAEKAFEEWFFRQRDEEEYTKIQQTDSFFDHSVPVELAPGEYLEQELRAADIPVPSPAQPLAAATSPMERLRLANRSYIERQPLQLRYYPEVTSEAPTPAGPRPTHPDDIHGPVVCRVLYGGAGGFEYLSSLGLTSIDGSKVLDIQDTTESYLSTFSLASQSPEYQEAVGQEHAATERLHEWPKLPKWKPEYAKNSIRPLDEIIQHNYSNVADYVDREALLTGKSIWECPIKVDPTCGRTPPPPHAEMPRPTIPRYPFEREEY